MKIIVEFMYTGRINAVRRRFASLRLAAFNIQMKRLLDLLTQELQQTKPSLVYQTNNFINCNIKKIKLIKNCNPDNSKIINGLEELKNKKTNEGKFFFLLK